MSIDYDWLQEMLDRYDSPEGSPFWRAGASAALDSHGTDIARELLRLHDGAQRALRVLEQDSPSKGLHARIILNRLLNGDTP